MLKKVIHGLFQMSNINVNPVDNQYSLLKIMDLLAAVALPVGFAGWVTFPMIAPARAIPTQRRMR